MSVSCCTGWAARGSKNRQQDFQKDGSDDGEVFCAHTMVRPSIYETKRSMPKSPYHREFNGTEGDNDRLEFLGQSADRGLLGSDRALVFEWLCFGRLPADRRFLDTLWPLFRYARIAWRKRRVALLLPAGIQGATPPGKDGGYGITGNRGVCQSLARAVAGGGKGRTPPG